MVTDEGLLNKIRDIFSVLVDWENLAIIMVSITCYLVWLMAFPLFGYIMNGYLSGMRALTIEKGMIIQTFLLTMTISSIGIGYLIDKSSKRTIFVYASALGVSILTFVLSSVNEITVVFPISAVLGIVAGISPPALGAYFADYTMPEERGRIIGFAVALSMLTAYSFMIFRPFNIGSIKHPELVIVGAISLLSLITMILKPQDKEIDEQQARRFRGLGTRQTTLYAIPVFLFYVVVGTMLSTVFPTIQSNLRPDSFYFIWGVPLFFSSILAGLLLDNWGRKTTMIVGLAIMGVSFGVLGILGIRSGFVTLITISIGYSIVTVTSYLIWADLAPMRSRGRYYGIGFGLIWFAYLIGTIISGNIFGVVSESRVKSIMFFSAITLFLSIPRLL